MVWKTPQRKFLTPDLPTITPTKTGRGILLDTEPVFLQSLVSGALGMLFDENNWEQYGSATPEETAQYFRNCEDIIMPICEAIIDCIQNDADTRTALADALTELGFSASGANGINAGYPKEVILNPTLFDNCATDDLYGACMEVVSAMDRLTNDLLEFIEVFTNYLEAQKKILEKIPVIGLLGEVGGIVDYYFEVMTELYTATYTQAVQEQIACEIFCLAKEDCKITMSIIRQAYANIVADTVAIPLNGTLQDIFDAILQIPLAVDVKLVAGIHSSFLEIFARGGEINGLTWRYIQIALEAYLPVTPLCECPFCQNFDYTINDGGFTAIDSHATYSSGQYWTAVSYIDGTNRRKSTSIKKTFTACTMTSIDVRFTSASVLQNDLGANNEIIGLLNGITVFTATETPQGYASLHTFSWSGEETIDEVQIHIYGGTKTGTGAFSPSQNGGNSMIRSVEFNGFNGSFGLDNCDGWCERVDFLQGNQGFTVEPNYAGLYTSNGWEGVTYQPSGGGENRGVSVAKTFGFNITRCTSVEMYYTANVLQNAGVYNQFTLLQDTTGLVNVYELAETQTEGHFLAWSGSETTFNKLSCQVWAGATNTPPLAPNEGECHLLYFILRGNGANPFGIGNC